MNNQATNRSLESCPILFGGRWPARGLERAIAAVDLDALCAEFAKARKFAPRRSLIGKSYFLSHSGVTSAAGKSNRLEEHCATALYNLGRRWPRRGCGWFRMLDYQVPLKARQSDAGVGKVDLLGVADTGRLMIIELKVPNKSGGRGDSPAAALMEGLRYAAILDADIEAIASEAEHRFGLKIVPASPIVQLLAPVSWWRSWVELRAAGNWREPFARLIASVEAQLGLNIECMAFQDVGVTYGLDGRPARLDRVPALHGVDPGGDPPIGDVIALQCSPGETTASYRDEIHERLWDHAKEKHRGALDGGSRQGRPPVLRPELAAKNVLVPPEGSGMARILDAIGPGKRHRHFASLRSSQALTQSVFGAIEATGYLSLLQGITAECGRPAFYTDMRAWKIELEHEVKTLGEPRPTSIDVLLEGSNGKVAVECKFTESEFGTCSRPRLRPGDPSYLTQRCDGNYRIQAGRGDRCPLTAMGIRYWEHLPKLFDWPANRDHEPCPFGAVYQLARNALAVLVAPDGRVDPMRGHVLILYDARNPAFQAGGTADLQLEDAVSACLVPGLIRRISWQRLLTFLVRQPDLNWLVEVLHSKYGLLADR